MKNINKLKLCFKAITVIVTAMLLFNILFTDKVVYIIANL